jgi:hypothetical protein
MFKIQRKAMSKKASEQLHGVEGEVQMSVVPDRTFFVL